MKYKLGKTHPDNPNLRRVIALKDIPLHDVSRGDEGGYIERESNLSQQGDCWVGGDARVSGNALVSGDALLFENALVSENAQVSGNAQVKGRARVSGYALVSGHARVYGYARVSGNARAYGNARVYGYAQVFGCARVSDGAQVYGGARVYGDALVFGCAWVYGGARVFGDARVSGNARVYGGARVSENARVSGNTRVFSSARVYGRAQVSEHARVYGGARVFGDARVCGYAGVDGYDDHRRILQELKKHKIGAALIIYSAGAVGEVSLDGSGPKSLRKLCEEFFYTAYQKIEGFENNEGGNGRLIVDAESEEIWFEHYRNTEDWGELKVVKVMGCEDLAIKAQAFDATEVCAEFSAEETHYVYMTRGRKRLSGQPGSEEFLFLFKERINQILENGNNLFLSDDGHGEVTLIVNEGVIEFKWAERETDSEHATIEVFSGED